MTEWKANWLLVHDNTCDPAHVPFLHGHFVSHAGNGEVRVEKMADGNPIVTEEGFGGLIQGAMTATTSDTKVLVELKDRDPNSSNEFGEVCFTLPCLASVYVPLPDGGPPVRLHQYELPIDEHTTRRACLGGPTGIGRRQGRHHSLPQRGFHTTHVHGLRRRLMDRRESARRG